MRSPALALLVALPLWAQSEGKGPAADYTFPTFTHGDGRQKLSEFSGNPVLVASFADGWGGTAVSQIALDLHEAHADDGLIVILAHQGPLHPDGPVEAAAWAMRLHPGAWVRTCQSVSNNPWGWGGLPHYYAVIGPDGELLGAGNVEANTKAMTAAVETALRRSAKGWGDDAEAAVRCWYGRGALAKARAKADACGLGAEVDARFERQCAAVRWLVADGQWLRAKKEAEQLAAGAKGVPAWDAAIAALLTTFADEVARRELDLDTKLARLTAPMMKKRPDDQLAKRLREFAKKHEPSPVAARAARLAELSEQSRKIR